MNGPDVGGASNCKFSLQSSDLRLMSIAGPHEGSRSNAIYPQKRIGRSPYPGIVARSALVPAKAEKTRDVHKSS